MKNTLLFLTLSLSVLLFSLPFPLHAESNSKSYVKDFLTMESDANKEDEFLKKFNKLNVSKQQIVVFALIRFKRSNFIDSLIKSGYDINYLYAGKSPLHFAIEEKNLHAIRILVKNSADLELKDEDQETALKSAVRTDNIEILEYLISQGADVNTFGKSGSTPLTTAAYKGNKEAIELLVSHDANINIKQEKNYWTLLHYAANYNHPHLVDYLIDNGINVDSRSKNGWSPLALASNKGNTEVVEKLLRHSPDIELPTKRSKLTPLLTAATNGHTEVVKLLLDAGADFERINNAKHDSLWLAANDSHSSTVLELLKVVKNSQEVFLKASSKGDFEVVRMLLKNGIDTDSRTKKGSTALHLAARYGHLDIVKLLHKHGADIHAIATNKKDTPLMRAAGWGKKNVLRYLLDQDVKVDIQNKTGWTAALSTARHHSLDSLKLLIEKGADIHKTTNSGWTILMLAAKGKKRNTIEYLLKQDLDLSLKNKKGQTALDIAIKSKNNAIIEMIKKAETDKYIISST